MDIYLIRHGKAIELDNEIVEEGYRYLNPEGGIFPTKWQRSLKT